MFGRLKSKTVVVAPHWDLLRPIGESCEMRDSAYLWVEQVVIWHKNDISLLFQGTGEVIRAGPAENNIHIKQGLILLQYLFLNIIFLWSKHNSVDNRQTTVDYPHILEGVCLVQVDSWNKNEINNPNKWHNTRHVMFTEFTVRFN